MCCPYSFSLFFFKIKVKSYEGILDFNHAPRHPFRRTREQKRRRGARERRRDVTRGVARAPRLATSEVGRGLDVDAIVKDAVPPRGPRGMAVPRASRGVTICKILSTK